jgi:hypothetical protein
MERGQMVLVACKIEAGAFSGERIFHLRLADGKTEYVGVAPVHSCFSPEKTALGRGEPSPGQMLDGFIEAFVVSNGGAEATIELPDGVPVPVSLSQVPYRLKRGLESHYVPV